MLSKKKMQPRIVKRRAKNDKKRTGFTPSGVDHSLWNESLTVRQNFGAMGLNSNPKPSMRQTNEGKKLLTEARVQVNAGYYKRMGISAPEEEEILVNQHEVVHKDLTEVFPEFKAPLVIKPTVKKLKTDERAIVEQMIKKYGPENHAKMSRDIKINYLQWSKG